jgi:2-keto-4-pentenoate hydratase
VTDRKVLVEAADRLDWARRNGTPCPPVRDILPPGDVAAAYAVQQIQTERRMTSGRRVVGRKIGLTSLAVQKQLGVDTPDFGVLFDDMAVPDGAEIPHGAVLQPRAEAEVALVLEHDLPHERNTVADLIRATAFVLPAIEVVGSRVAGWDITIVDTVADNGSAVSRCPPARARPAWGIRSTRRCGWPTRWPWRATRCGPATSC